MNNKKEQLENLCNFYKNMSQEYPEVEQYKKEYCTYNDMLEVLG